MCFAEQVFFARLGARSVAPQRRAYARRAARRRLQYTWYVHNVFTEPTVRKSCPARAKRRRTRTRIALLTVHNSSSCFLCSWHRACAASPCLPRPCKVAPCRREVAWKVSRCDPNVASGQDQPRRALHTRIAPNAILRSSEQSKILRSSESKAPIPVEFFKMQF